MTPEIGTPTSNEIDHQLARMRSAKRFRNAENQSDFLALVVQRALRGKKTSGHIIAKALFREKPVYYVRVTASNLRSTLKKYQAQEGREDLVVIALPDPPKDKRIKLPEGEAYTPTFSYNPKHAASKEYRMGEYHRKRGMFADYNRALKHFSAALKLAPEHVGATIGMAEVMCGVLKWDLAWDHPRIGEVIEIAATMLNTVDGHTEQYWRLWAARGFVATNFENLKEAREMFDKALALDRSSTEAYLPYLGFLFVAGEEEKAMKLAAQYLDAHPDEIAAYVNYAKLLAELRRFDMAASVLQDALAIDRGYYAVHELLTILSVVQVQPQKIFEHLDQMSMLVPEEDAVTVSELKLWVVKAIKLLWRVPELIPGTPAQLEAPKDIAKSEDAAPLKA